MAQKTKGAENLPAGTMQQRMQLAELRKEAGLLKSVRELDRMAVTAARLQDDEALAINRMGILLQDAYNLKFLLCDPDPKVKEKLGKMDINEEPVIVESLSKNMAVVSGVKLADDATLSEMQKRGIGLRESAVCKMIEELRGSRKPQEGAIQELLSTAYQLALLKSFASKPHIGKQMMKDFYLETIRFSAGLRGGGSRYDFIEGLVQREITSSPEERLANLREGLSNLASLFTTAEEKLGQISAELGAISKNEGRLLAALSNEGSREAMAKLGLHRDFTEDPRERAEIHIPAVEALIQKKCERLEAITDAIANQTDETRIREFSGMAKKRLRHIAATWEDLEEHTSAPWRLAHIYAELGEWAKAKKWIEEDINRGFAKFDYEGITQSLKFGLKLALLSKDEEWRKSLNGKLAAHISVPSYMIQRTEMRQGTRAKGAAGGWVAGYG